MTGESMKSKRMIDIIFASCGLVFFLLPMLVVALLIKLSSHGPVLHWSSRVGARNKQFLMPKFRTMKLGTPQVATHLLLDSQQWLTPLGGFLRRSSIDELPQLWSVLTGDMSIVGPRPALFNQKDLIILRTMNGIDNLTPGLTGWAQINGRDEVHLAQKVSYDYWYLTHQSLRLDLWIIYRTIWKVVSRDGIRQADEARSVRARRCA